MTERDILIWINKNLGTAIDRAIVAAREKFPDHPYTKDWLSAIIMRETGFLIARYVKQGVRPEVIHTLMRGDYSQRPGEKEKSYHGYGYTQIDIGSYPAFVKSGDWKDPFKVICMAIAVLEEKRAYLQPRFPNLQGDGLHRAITAAYNCGQGNVAKVIEAGQDIDARTYNHDYSREVWRFREIFKTITQ
jgi:hypothetical protein